MSAHDITRVVRVFEETKTRWVLVGAHAVGLVTTPRATADFDFVVEGVRVPAVLDGLREAFGELDVIEIGAAIRLRAIDIDLIRSNNHLLFAKAIDHARKAGNWNVPRPEVIIALRFMSALSPWRASDKRAMDIIDLHAMYRATGADQLSIPLMMELAGLAYPNAGRELRALLEKIDRGEPIAI